MPELTVVIPTKDRPTMLPRAIRSVLGQVEDAEVVVVDDGSTAVNAEIIRKECADPRVRLQRNDVSGWAPHARNQGLDLASSRYWATLDDDDEWLPGKWAAQRGILEMEGFPEDLVVVSGMRSSRQGRDRVVMPKVPEPVRLSGLSDLFGRVPISAFSYTFVAPTQLLRSIGGWDERAIWGEYTDMLIRLSKVARFVGPHHVGANAYREHEQADSRVGRNWDRKVEGIRLLLETHREEFEHDPEVLALYLHVLGVSQLRVGDRWGAAETFRRVVRVAPSPGRRARGLAQLATTVIGGPRLWRWLARSRGVPADVIG